MTSTHPSSTSDQQFIDYPEDLVVCPYNKHRKYRPVGKRVRWLTLATRPTPTLFRVEGGSGVHLCLGAVVGCDYDESDKGKWSLCGTPYWDGENPWCQPLERL